MAKKKKMSRKTKEKYVIDPDGEVMIILVNLNATFAEWDENIVEDTVPEPLPSPDNDYTEPVEEVIEPPESLEPAGEAIGPPGTPVVDELNNGMSEETVSPPKRYFRVSAKHLTLASPVFKRTLTGAWTEASALSEKGSVDITVEDWDDQALLLFLNIIHCRHHKVPRHISLEMLAKIAVLADYYECRNTLDFFSKIWISGVEKEGLPITYSRDLILWLWIAWFFRLSDHLKKASSIAMSESNGLIKSLGLPIPGKVIDEMNSHRVNNIESIIAMLYSRRDEFYNGERGCDFNCSSILYGLLTRHMQSIGLLLQQPSAPYPSVIYKNLVERVRSFEYPSLYKYYHHGGRHSCDDSSFKSIVQGVEASIEGLRLVMFLF